MYSDDVNSDKRLDKYFAVLYVAVPTFDMIGLKVKFLTVFFFFLICELSLFHKMNQALMISDIFVSNLLHSNIYFFFKLLSKFCNFVSVPSVGYCSNSLNWSVLIKFMHFSIDFVLSNMTVPYPLSWFSNTVFLFCDKFLKLRNWY